MKIHSLFSFNIDIEKQKNHFAWISEADNECASISWEYDFNSDCWKLECEDWDFYYTIEDWQAKYFNSIVAYQEDLPIIFDVEVKKKGKEIQFIFINKD